MSKYIIVTTTTDKKEEASKIVDLLLEKGLVSCCQVHPITSKYHWQGSIETSNEFIITMKSKKELYKEIEKTLLKIHTYETPEIVSYEIDNGYKKYLDWIDEETI